MKKVLITGATGLVGSHLVVGLLRSGDYEVHCAVRSTGSIAKLEAVCKYFDCDISTIHIHEVVLEDREAFLSLIREISPSVLFHTAATVSLDGMDSELMIRGNVDLAEAVTEVLHTYNSNTTEKILLVHVSSIAAIGAAKEVDGEIDETCEIAHTYDLEAYSLSKFLSENVIFRGSMMGTPTVIINPSVVLGVTGDGTGNEGLQSAIKMMWRGIPFYTSAEMGFVDVRDVARAMVAIAEKVKAGKGAGLLGERFIVSGHNLCYRELIGSFAAQFGARKPWLLAPKWLLKIGLALVWLWCKIFRLRAMLTPSMIGFMTSKSRYSSAKLLSQLPDFQYTSMRDTVEMIARRTVSG